MCICIDRWLWFEYAKHDCHSVCQMNAFIALTFHTENKQTFSHYHESPICEDLLRATKANRNNGLMFACAHTANLATQISRSRWCWMERKQRDLKDFSNDVPSSMEKTVKRFTSNKGKIILHPHCQSVMDKSSGNQHANRTRRTLKSPLCQYAKTRW